MAYCGEADRVSSVRGGPLGPGLAERGAIRYPIAVAFAVSSVLFVSCACFFVFCAFLQYTGLVIHWPQRRAHSSATLHRVLCTPA